MSAHNKAPPLEKLWPEVSRELRGILVNLNKGMSQQSYITLYTKIFNYVSAMGAENDELYRRTKEILKTRIIDLVEQSKTLPDEQLLIYFVDRWNEWVAIARIFDKLMAYLNRTWVKTQRSSSTAAEVLEIGLTAEVVWRDHMLVGGLKERLGDAMLRLIRDDRNGVQIQDHLIRNCLHCFERMGLNKENPQNPTLEIYKQHFEKRFLEETEVYYTGEAMRVLNEGGVAAYLKKTEQRIHEEEQRVTRFLNKTTQPPLIEVLEKVLLTAHKEAIQGKFVDLLRNDANDDLKRMYTLLKRVDPLEQLRNLFEQFVRTVGLDAIAAEKNDASEKPEVFVNILLRIFRKYTQMINSCFVVLEQQGDPQFIISLDKAFREFVNKNAVTDNGNDGGGAGDDRGVAKAPQILAKYCDQILRKGSSINEDEMERTQNDVVSLFKYFPDKDVFMMVYSKLLSKRLINELSQSEDSESAMIAKLKVAQGFEFTVKLQRMITDVGVSKDINRQFQESLTSNGVKLPLAFNIMVLATGSWPLQMPSSNFHVPDEVNLAVEQFKAYYDKKYQGRKLNYLHHLSRAELDLRSAKGKCRLVSTTYQMGVMLMFSETTGPLHLRDISAHTMLQDTVLKQSLWPLVKLNIINCKAGPNPDNWNETTEFEFNSKFIPKKPRLLTIPGPVGPGQKDAGSAAAAADKQQHDEENAEVMRDRALKLQAAIVRVMKARKTLSHNELVQETINQVSRWFGPKIADIKKAIESLIDQEFIKRGKDLKTFEYIA